ncbi:MULTISPECIES: hypothetical protein [unclassified Saccharicrinis]|uniref:hypothetical protein n=1 Tax=unclassified Saccharicrinis TaxID=2646859 RepID=UPI003D33030D
MKKWITKSNGMETEEPTSDILYIPCPTIEVAAQGSNLPADYIPVMRHLIGCCCLCSKSAEN